MKYFYGTHFEDAKPRFWKSWSFISSAAAEDFRQLAGSGKLRRDGGEPVIWQTQQKYVLKVSCGNRSYAYKSYTRIRQKRKYLFRLSPCGLEAKNYQRFQDIGMPMAELAAVGEKRFFCLIRDMFFMTKFAENFNDGRVFGYGGELRRNKELRDEFIRRNLLLLAKCHDSGYLHGGFTPANILWHLREEPDAEGNRLDLCWIDVATARKLSIFHPAKILADDPAHFFRFLGAEENELREYLQLYYDALEIKRLPFDRLCKEVKNRI